MWARRENVGEEWAVGMLSDTNCLLASLGLGPCTAHHLPHAPPQLQLIRLEAQLAATYFIIMSGPKRAFASSQGHATMSPVEVDLRPSLVARPSPERAHASSQGQATMSPAEADLRKTRRLRRKRELRKLRGMYMKGVRRILRWGHSQGRTSFSLRQVESDFFDWWKVPFSLAGIRQPDMATFLRRFPSKMEVYSDEGVTKVRLSAQEVEWVREQIRKGKPWTWGPPVSPTPAVAACREPRASPSPRRGASPDASLLPIAASSSQPEGRSAASCARTSTAAGSVQPKPTAPAANIVPCPRWVAASALPKPPAASSSTPDGRVAKLQSSAPGEAAKAASKIDVLTMTTASNLQAGKRGVGASGSRSRLEDSSRDH